jgi:hypothetical protein
MLTAALVMVAAGGCSDSDSSAPAALGVPSNVQTSNITPYSVDVSWNAISGVTDYKLYYSIGNSVDPTTAQTIDCKSSNCTSATCTCTVTGLEYWNMYTMGVAAMYGTSESARSESKTIQLPPTPPQSVAAATESMSGNLIVNVSWAEVYSTNTYTVTYNVYRSATSPVPTTDTPLLEDFAVLSYQDDVADDGTKYYYVVTAKGPGGESAPSDEVFAIASIPPGAPQNVSVIRTPETTLSATLSWAMPTTGTPDSYEIYRSETAGASYPANHIKSVSNSTYQYIDNTNLLGNTTYYWTVSAKTAGGESPANEVSVKIIGSPGGGGGGGDTGFGNNLSVPLIFADGFGVAGGQIVSTWTFTAPFEYNTNIRPLSTETNVTLLPYFDPATIYTLNTVTYYKQATASTWQAEWNVFSGETVTVNAAFGDNLSSQTLRSTSSIRVEVVLTAPTTTPMMGYTMVSLYGSRENEVTGTDGSTYLATEARVYATNGALKIEKLDGPGGNVVYTYLDKAAYEKFGVDGPTDGVAGELNVSGSVSFGYNWALNTTTIPVEKTGWWRITFYLKDPYSFSTFVDLPNKVIIGSTNATLVSPTEAMIEVQIAK